MRGSRFRGTVLSFRFVVIVLLLLAQLLLAGIAYAPPQIRCVDWCNPDNPGPPVPVPDPGCASANISALQATVVISGVITNPRGLPISGACVYWVDGSSYATAPTSSTGAYVISVLADRPVTLIANHTIFQFQEKYISNPVLASASPQNFTLLYLLTTRVTPNVFNNIPQKTLTFMTYSTVSQVGSRVLAQLPGGSAIELAYDLTYTDPSGWKLWTGTWTVPVGTADGVYTYYSCALDGGAGSCQSPAGLVLSQVKDQLFVVDSIPPVVSAQSPIPSENTILRRPTISAIVKDSLSGVDLGTPRLYLDAAQLSASFNAGSGKLSFTPPTDLAIGIHRATATAQDLAGNSASSAWEFSITTLSATSSYGRLEEQTVQVNPSNAIPPPSMVTFRNIVITLDPYDLTLGPSPYTGYGAVKRTVDLSQAEVTFTNETGIPKAVPVNPGTAPFATQAGILLPERGDTTARIPEGSFTKASVIVDVPTGYNTAGSAATLRMAPVGASAITLPSGDNPTSNHIPNGVSVFSLSVTAGVEVTETNASAVSVSASRWSMVRGSVTLPGGTRIPAFTPAVYPGPPVGADAFSNKPSLICNSSQPDTDTRCVYLGYDGLDIVPYIATSKAYLNLGDGEIQLYANHWLYRRSSESVYVDWQQSSAQVTSRLCPGGSISLALKRFTNEAHQMLQATHPWSVSQFRMTNVAPDTLTVALPWGNNSLSNTGQVSLQGAFSGPVSSIPPEEGRSQSTWTSDIDPGSTNLEQMITASEFSSATTTYPKVMRLEDRHEWTINYAQSC